MLDPFPPAETLSDPLAELRTALADRYRLEREIGHGGMATVYLAEDPRHRRKVALKVLKPGIAAALGPERFLREIETTANLRHPHILPLFDSGTVSGSTQPPNRPAAQSPYYVMPFVEGESLQERLRRERRLPLGEALRIAREVADALAYAHERGVIHRDIKPGNILLEAGHAVVADFGIARAIQVAEHALSTDAGLALGTPTYMSPEQAAGETALDGRSDLYSLGCVLYEMLSGEPPFQGATAAEIVGQHVGKAAASLSTPGSGVPAGVGEIVERLLAKDPADRYRDARTLVAALDRAMPRGSAGTGVATLPPGRRGWVVAGALALAAGAIALAYLGLGPSPTTPPVVHLRQVTTSTEVEEYPALSPDGHRVVFSRDLGGIRQLFVVNLPDGAESRITRDSSDAIQPVWTPDGRAVVFTRARKPGMRLEPGDVFGEFAGGDLWRRDLESGAEERLVEEAANPAVAPDGRLAFDAIRGATHRIWVADARGRNAEQVSQDSSEAVAHVAPRWSPDGRFLVFQKNERTVFDIRVVEVATRKSRAVTNDGFTDVQPVWDPSGRAIWFSSTRTGGLNVWRMPVTPDGTPSGPAMQMTTGAGQDVELSVSAAGGRMAFSVLRLNADLWRLPVDPGTGRPTGAPEAVIQTTREDSRGAWSPDGKTLAFNSDRGGDMNIWLHSLADGSDRQLTRGPGGDYQPRWSANGNRIVFFSARSGNADIWTVDVATGQLAQLTRSPWLELNPSYSPDGSQIAFHSDRGGRFSAWVMNADGSAPRELTPNGVGFGHFLPWSPDGNYVYLRDSDAAGTPSRVSLIDGTLEAMPIKGGFHMSLGPGGTLVSDVVNHRQLWISPLDGGPYATFTFPDPDVRIDYPVWSPDGRWILFDRSRPEGGDIWLMETGK